MRLALALLSTLVLSAAASAADAPLRGNAWLAEMKAMRAAAPAEPSEKVVKTNPDRAYPPSCLSNPLPTTPKGPVTTITQSLADIDGNDAGFNGQFGYFETVTVRVSRVACSNGKSAVIVSFERTGNKAQTFPAPDVPAPWATLSGGSLTPIRLVAEPNTWQAYDGGNTIYYAQQVYVLELIPGYIVDLNAAFTLSLDTIANNQTVRTNVNIPAYNPATNPDSSLALEITGYQAGTYYDTAHGGEGIVFDVGERANGTRFAFFAWFTYDKQGFPYWIVGNADVPAGARSITIPALVFDNGGFAGAFTPPLPSQSWGSVTFTFRSCNVLTLQFASTLTSTSIPTGSGTRLWSRLTGVNGFSCE